MRCQAMRPLILLRTLAIATATVVTSSAAVRAADMPGNYTLPPPRSMDEPILRRVEVYSGWYLRGDIGYRFQHLGSASTGDATLVPLADSSKIANAAMLGLGAGYKWSWFRADLTGDYGWRGRYTGTTAAGTTFTGKIDDFTVMMNGYVDLGSWAGFTPYVGAGIGGANVIFSSYVNQSAIAPMPTTEITNTYRWNVAWAAMAGFSYSLRRDFLIDVGYRYIDMGDVSGGPSTALKIKHFTGNEIRVGFRYLLD